MKHACSRFSVHTKILWIYTRVAWHAQGRGNCPTDALGSWGRHGKSMAKGTAWPHVALLCATSLTKTQRFAPRLTLCDMPCAFAHAPANFKSILLYIGKHGHPNAAKMAACPPPPPLSGNNVSSTCAHAWCLYMHSLTPNSPSLGEAYGRCHLIGIKFEHAHGKHTTRGVPCSWLAKLRAHAAVATHAPASRTSKMGGCDQSARKNGNLPQINRLPTAYELSG